MDHPNIIKYYETFESVKFVYIVMEYCGGGELFSHLTNTTEAFTEHQASEIMHKLFLAVNHCHSNGIAHRDIKAENIMYSSEKKDIKIIDFGLSKIKKDLKKDSF